MNVLVKMTEFVLKKKNVLSLMVRSSSKYQIQP